MNTLELKASAKKQAGYLIIFIGLAIVGGFMAADGDTVMGVAAVLLGSAGSAVFAALLIRPQKLIIDEKGFALTGGIKKEGYRFRWQDIESFGVMRVRSAKMVGYNFATGYEAPHSLLRGLNVDLAGYEAAIPDVGMKPEQLSELLNDWKRRH